MGSGVVAGFLRSKRVPRYVFARRVEKRVGRGKMSEHRLNKLLSGRIKGVEPQEISHITAELVELGAELTEDQVREDLDRASRDHWEGVAIGF